MGASYGPGRVRASLFAVALLAVFLFPHPASAAQPARRGRWPAASRLLSARSLTPARRNGREAARAAIAKRTETTMSDMERWKAGRFRGANVRIDTSGQDLRDLRAEGANLVRVVLSDETVETEPPYGLKESGLKQLDRLLDEARAAGLKAVLGCLAAPGRRDVPDRRLWEQPETHLAFARLWKELAERYRNNPTLVGYDLLSEPDPEVLFDGQYRADLIPGTTADWNLLAKRLTLAIREADPDRPVIVEAGAWGYARGFTWLQPTGDPKTVYSFHMFSPHLYTHQEPEAPLAYPGQIPAYVEPAGRWDAEALKSNMEPAYDFQSRFHVPIYVGSFGVRRTAPGADAFARDLMTLFEKAGWHWSFWSFRDSRDWDSELGPDPASSRPCTTARAPLFRTYRDFLALNDHPGLLQDLPLLKDDAWIEPMRAAHRQFTGLPGTVSLLGDSITFGSEFMTPLFTDNYTGDPRTLSDLRRFRENVGSGVADWKGPDHGNRGGWHLADGLACVSDVLARDDPEVALVMFGTNDLIWGLPKERHFEANLRQFLDLLLSNGTIPILSTLPPKLGSMKRLDAYNKVIRGMAKTLQIPLVDYSGAILRRRPSRWYRTLIIGDGVHPSYPPAYRSDLTETGLYNSGFTLRNFLSMEAVLSVLDRIRQPTG